LRLQFFFCDFKMAWTHTEKEEKVNIS